MKLVVVGVGKMGRSILEGALRAGYLAKEEIGVLEHSPHTAEVAREQGVPLLRFEDLRLAERVVIAVQPRDFPALAPRIVHPNLGYISIMAGVSTYHLAERLGTRRVVRSMPNLAATIGRSSTALTAPPEAEEAGDLSAAHDLFATLGDVYDLPEHLFDAFTAMVASAPAYFALFAEALADGGVKQGIPRAQAYKMAADVLIATGELLKRKHPAVIKDEVASPGGTTIYCLAALEDRGVRAALIEAVDRATQRSRNLGER